ncbi:MAG: ATP-binding cassette domain-containing protein [Firmicutes bacterium]|nr:ATP-binding cassette domain-containing protein [Bacillota bacterium]
MSDAMKNYLVEVKNVSKFFPIKSAVSRKILGNVKAVDDVSFGIKKGTVLGIVGESGCGKSTVARVIIGLLSPTAGEVYYDGIRVDKADRKTQHELKKRMQIVFQDPFSSLDPRMTVYEIVGEPLKNFGLVKNKAELRQRVEELVSKCGLFPDQCNRYPHQFSGGQRQRICIARALASNPDFVICDEAVSALDVSIQAQVINLLKDLQEDLSLTYLFISHDLSVVEFISDEVAVMYLGKIVEKGTTEQIFKNPLHPYTQALLASSPAFTPEEKATKEKIILEGDIPSPVNTPPGCYFSPRCKYAMEECKKCAPNLVDVGEEHFVACRLIDAEK